MSSVKVIKWIDNYRGFIGALSDKDADNWANVIRSNVRNVLAGEVDNAVASLCAEERANGYKPNAMSIIKRIHDQRRMNKPDEIHCHPIAQYYAADEFDNLTLCSKSMDDLKMDLDYAANDPHEAWSIICQPLDLLQCQALEAYAKKRGVKYTRHQCNLSGALEAIGNKYDAAV